LSPRPSRASPLTSKSMRAGCSYRCSVPPGGEGVPDPPPRAPPPILFCERSRDAPGGPGRSQRDPGSTGKPKHIPGCCITARGVRGGAQAPSLGLPLHILLRSPRKHQENPVGPRETRDAPGSTKMSRGAHLTARGGRGGAQAPPRRTPAPPFAEKSQEAPGEPGRSHRDPGAASCRVDHFCETPLRHRARTYQLATNSWKIGWRGQANNSESRARRRCNCYVSCCKCCLPKCYCGVECSWREAQRHPTNRPRRARGCPSPTPSDSPSTLR
jgi:hypothetical protein